MVFDKIYAHKIFTASVAILPSLITHKWSLLNYRYRAVFKRAFRFDILWSILGTSVTGRSWTRVSILIQFWGTLTPWNIVKITVFDFHTRNKCILVPYGLLTMAVTPGWLHKSWSVWHLHLLYHQKDRPGVQVRPRLLTFIWYDFIRKTVFTDDKTDINVMNCSPSLLGCEIVNLQRVVKLDVEILMLLKFMFILWSLSSEIVSILRLMVNFPMRKSSLFTFIFYTLAV